MGAGVTPPPAAEIPDGFEPLGFRNGFSELIGPILVFQDNEVLRIGFRCERRHGNMADGLHGGMIAAFADIFLTCGAIYHSGLRSSVITVSLTCDFLSTAKPGDWIEANSRVLRMTRSMVFVDGVASVGDRPVLRASAVLKIGTPVEHRWIRRDHD